MPEKTTQKEHGKKTAPPSEKEVQPEVVIQIPLAKLGQTTHHLAFLSSFFDNLKVIANFSNPYTAILQALDDVPPSLQLQPTE